MELLSPAGSPESCRAAVQGGADAVYLGYGAFNARRNAKNFSEEELFSSIAYCHLYGVRVYLTMNTLLSDRELPEAAAVARLACRAGVDAILVQDWGVLEMLRQVVPEVPLHASTQMSLFTLSGVKEAAKCLLTRAVLARECSKEEIAEICKESPIEIETFGHGALCMCYSGQCEFSAVIGGRSGNRGTCAQPCRLPYGINGPAKAYPLSLKDACLANDLSSLENAGVACLKLEGRMKRPEYVYTITSIYAKLLKEKRKPTKEEWDQLVAAFSRDGFTTGYWEGKKGPHMFGVRSPNAKDPEGLFSKAKQTYEKVLPRKIPITMNVTFHKGEPVRLSVTDDQDHHVFATGPVPEVALFRSLSQFDLEERLRKTGGTPYEVTQIQTVWEDGFTLSASVLNQLRREALDTLTEYRSLPLPREEGTYTPSPKTKAFAAKEPKFTCSLRVPQQLTKELLSCHPAIVYFPLEWMEQEISLPSFEGAYCVVLPRIYRDKDLPLFQTWLQKAKELGVTDLAISNLGHLPLAEGFTLHGDFGLNLYNSDSLAFWQKRNLASATVSMELRQEQIRDLQKPLPLEAIVYGRLPLMITENCPIHNTIGCHCQEKNDLIDRKNAKFPLLPAYGCRCEIQNSTPLFLADKPEWKELGLTYARLRFTVEEPEECVAVFRRYLGESSWVPSDFTRGLFYRGVE